MQRCWGGGRETGKEGDEVNGKKFPVCPNSGGEGEKYRQKSCSTMRKMQLADKRARSHKLALATVNYFLAQMWLSLSLVEKTDLTHFYEIVTESWQRSKSWEFMHAASEDLRP